MIRALLHQKDHDSFVLLDVTGELSTDRLVALLVNDPLPARQSSGQLAAAVRSRERQSVRMLGSIRQSSRMI